jgi:hypothetical protein
VKAWPGRSPALPVTFKIAAASRRTVRWPDDATLVQATRHAHTPGWIKIESLPSGGKKCVYKYENLEEVKEYPLSFSYTPDDPAYGKQLEARFVVKK